MLGIMLAASGPATAAEDLFATQVPWACCYLEAVLFASEDDDDAPWAEIGASVGRIGHPFTTGPRRGGYDIRGFAVGGTPILGNAFPQGSAEGSISIAALAPGATTIVDGHTHLGPVGPVDNENVVAYPHETNVWLEPNTRYVLTYDTNNNTATVWTGPVAGYFGWRAEPRYLTKAEPGEAGTYTVTEGAQLHFSIYIDETPIFAVDTTVGERVLGSGDVWRGFNTLGGSKYGSLPTGSLGHYRYDLRRGDEPSFLYTLRAGNGGVTLVKSFGDPFETGSPPQDLIIEMAGAELPLDAADSAFVMAGTRQRWEFTWDQDYLTRHAPWLAAAHYRDVLAVGDTAHVCMRHPEKRCAAYPRFGAATSTTRALPETPGDAVATPIGAPVTVPARGTATSSPTIAYRLLGADAAKFAIATSTGQLYTLPHEPYDHEADKDFAVVVEAAEMVRRHDSEEATHTATSTAFIVVQIEVTDVPEAPVFTATTTPYAFDETVGSATVQTAFDVGPPVAATDDDGDALVYTLEGTHAAKFDIVADTGQLRTRVGERYSYEDAASYLVTVKADDLKGGTATIEVTIEVTNVDEPPLAPTGVRSRPTDADVVLAEWNAPDDAGRPVVTGYRVQYRLPGGLILIGNWLDRTHTRSRLEVAIDYEVRVQARNAEGSGQWSPWVDGSTVPKAPPVSPAAPTVEPVDGDGSRLDVSWTAPDNGARPAILSYDLQYQPSGGACCADGPQDVAGTTATLTGLEQETAYEVQVRATNVNGDSAWSPFGSGTTAAHVNASATGRPAIAGLPYKGQTLRAGPGDVEDANGLDDAVYAYQWLRTDAAGDNPVEIDGATARDYTLERADIGRRVSVRVHFDDDADFAESRTSRAYPPDRTVGPAIRTLVRNLDAGGTAGTRSLGGDGDTAIAQRFTTGPGPDTVLADVTIVTSSGPFSALTVRAGDAADPGAVVHTLVAPDTTASGDRDFVAPPGAVLKRDTSYFVMAEGSGGFWTWTSDTESGEDGWRIADAARVRSHSVWNPEAAGHSLRVRLRGHDVPNATSTGRPAITGTPTVGETLTADTSAIADDDGLTAPGWTYRWLRVDADGESHAEYLAATSTTYLLAPADAGHRIKVQVDFTDDAGHTETATSAAFPALGTVTAPANRAPYFPGPSATRSFDETFGAATAATAFAIGAPVAATDDDDDPLAYTLAGADAARFDVDAATGQLRARVGQGYSYEDASSYTVTVQADDGRGGTATVAVTVEVANLVEPPLAPAALTLTASGPGQILASWQPPDAAGRPPTAAYDVRYRPALETGWTSGPQGTPATAATLSGLLPWNLYTVAVRARSAEGAGPYLARDVRTEPSAVSFQGGSEPASAAEGDDLAVSLHFDPAPAADVTVPLEVTHRGGASAADYTLPATVDVPAGAPAGALLLSVTDDAFVDPGESLVIGFGDLPDALHAVAPATLTVALLDNETAGRVWFEAVHATATEGGAPASVRVHIGGPPFTDDLVVPIRQRRLRGATAGDYVAAASVTFAAATSTDAVAASVELAVTAVDDAEDDDFEALRLGIGELPTGWQKGSPATVEIALADNDGSAALVSNFAHQTATSTANARRLAAALDTGTTTHRHWRLDAVTVLQSATRMRAAHVHAGGAEPGARLATLDGPTASLPLQQRFTTPDGIVLAAAARYFVVFDTGADDDNALVQTLDDAETSAYGWRIDDRNRRRAAAEAWSAEPPVPVLGVTGHANRAATGTVALTGVAAVGRRLTAATTTTVVDPDGLATPRYQYRFYRLAGGTRELVATSTDRYRLTLADGGASIEAALAFEDDLGFPEELSSPALAVPAPEPATARFGASSYRAAEGGAQVTVAVRMSGYRSGPVTVGIVATPRNGATAADYTLSETRLEFATTTPELTFTVGAVDDGDSDTGEAVALTLSLPPGVEIGTPAEAVVALVDDDGPPPTLGRVVLQEVFGEARAVTVKWWEMRHATRYEVQWRGPGQGYDAARQRTVAATGLASGVLRIAGLAANTRYTVRVRGTLGGAAGPWSEERSAVTEAAAAAPVLTLHGVRTRVAPNVPARYTVRRSAQRGRGIDTSADLRYVTTGERRVPGEAPWSVGGEGRIPAGAREAEVSYLLEDLGVRYTETVALVAGAGYEVGSPSRLTITVLAAPDQPAAVTDLTASGAYRQIDARWTAVRGADQYVVDWHPAGTASGCGGPQCGSGRYVAGPFTRIRGLDPAREYWVGVRAHRVADDVRGDRAAASATTLAEPQRVQGLALTPRAAGVLAVWEEASDARSYEVQWQGGGQGYAADRTVRVFRERHLVDGLSTGTYTVRVRGGTAHDPGTSSAYDEVHGPWSDEVSAAVTLASLGMAGVTLAGDRLTLGYAEALDAASVPAPRDFVVVAGAGAARAAVDVVAVTVTGRAAVLALARPLRAEEAVAVSYLPAAMHPLRSTAGAPAAPFADLPARHALAPAPGTRAPGDSGALSAALPAGAVAAADLAALVSAAHRARGMPLDRLTAAGHGLDALAALADLGRLRELDLGGNAVADLATLSTLTRLEALDLSGNRIADLWPLSGLDALARLDLSHNRIVDLGALRALTGLEVLLLDGNAVTDLRPLAHLYALRHLSLAGNRVADATLLADLPALVRLDLSGNRLADVAALGDLSVLVWLRLAGNPVADLDPLGRLTHLRWVWLPPNAPPWPHPDRRRTPVWTDARTAPDAPAHP